MNDRTNGKVYFVSAGPGAADLLTVRAADVLRKVGTVLHDSLVGRAVLEQIPSGVERISCGSRTLSADVRQRTILDLMLRRTRSGTDVARLKGGDATIFGRLGEEVAFLREHSVEFEIVPGVTAATAAASALAVPLTHRDMSDGVIFLSGRTGEGKTVESYDWRELATGHRTIALYMGVRDLPTVRDLLLAHGARRSLPVAVVEKVSFPDERRFAGTLASIADIVEAEGIASPAIFLIGHVVSLAAAPVGASYAGTAGATPVAAIPVGATSPGASDCGTAMGARR